MGDVVRKVVVVFDWLEGRGLAEETEVVNGDRGWEEGLEGWVEFSMVFGCLADAKNLRSCQGRSGE